MRRILSILILAAAWTTPAAAQAPLSEAGKAVLGAWEISNADRDKTCAATFRDTPVPGGYRLELDRNCLTAFPAMRDVVAWNVGGLDLVRLVDARGRPVYEFTEMESGMYEAERRGEGIHFMQSLAAVSGPLRTADSLFGEWVVTRAAGRPLCALTLTDTPAAGTDTWTLRVKPGCEALVTRFGPTAWRVDRGELVLIAPRGTWRFEETEPTTWRRVPETGDPVLLVRQEAPAPAPAQ
jgi:hypothetical protein